MQTPASTPSLASPTRRGFLTAGLAAGALASRLNAQPQPRTNGQPAGLHAPITDTNHYIGQWPFRAPLNDDATRIEKLLATSALNELWIGSLDGLLHRDIGSVNARLAEFTKRSPQFVAMGSINLTLPRWEDDMERCANTHHMRGIRLHPNYHSYTLDDARFVELLKFAQDHKLIVQIACVMEDERTQHPLVRTAPVDVSPLPKALEGVPDARVMLLNWQRMSGGKPTLVMLKDARVMFDIAMLESIAGIEALLEELPADRIVFGSYAPVFYFESAKLKLQESALSDAQLADITHGNAAGLFQH